MIEKELKNSAISALFRDIAKGSWEGVLTVSSAQESTAIYFQRGRIVDASDGQAKSLAALLTRLQDAQIIPQAVASGIENLEQLAAVIPRYCLEGSQELLKKAREHSILDLVYRALRYEKAKVRFEEQSIEAPTIVPVAISVSQVLLDAVALKAEESRFRKFFKENVSLSTDIPRDANLTVNEHLITAVIGKQGRLEEVRKKSLLSAYQFEEAVLSLYDRGWLGVRLPEKIPDKLVDPSKPQQAPQGGTQAQEFQHAAMVHPHLLVAQVQAILLVLFVVSAIVLPLVFWVGLMEHF